MLKKNKNILLVLSTISIFCAITLLFLILTSCNSKGKMGQKEVVKNKNFSPSSKEEPQTQQTTMRDAEAQTDESFTFDDESDIESTISEDELLEQVENSNLEPQDLP